MASGTKGMGDHKHGTSGRVPISPKAKHRMKLEAERNEIKAKPSTCRHKSVLELMSTR